MIKALFRRIFTTLLFLFSALLSFLSGGFMSDNDSKIAQTVGLITAVVGLIRLIVSVTGDSKKSGEGSNPKDKNSGDKETPLYL